MDLQQPLLNNNSSCRSPSTTGGVLLQPTTTANVENIAAAIVSPSTSPTTGIVNHHHNHRNSQSVVTQKSNQVSTVLLYNIPIVSLYIEGQERLCLAQISNTLLKQFSYNEIHNRRVALGITCVQCTPVQLEILRRAGAMPVSSRRCGMITRREAERLCKSFLGDNTPPRLPEDFAFNVQHKCSWGCRGSFLPSRYNSSRAKCIKCHYCGMFFSPNKFIFHSHRIGPGDKYVQPDAANFNSWRRHMMLSGQPPQEVIYAWEDVKAMFNGGTRKRLMTSNSSSPLPRVTTSSPSSCSAGASSSNINQSTEDGLSVNSDSLINNTQKVQKSSNSVNTVTAAAAVVGVTAVAVGSTVRPLNLHFQASTAAGLATESSYAVGADMHLIPAAALSRSFMMDYMWQHAHQAAKNTYNQHYQQQPKVKSSNSAFTFPWINATVGTTSDIPNHDNHHSSINYSQSVNTRWPNATNSTDIARNLTQIINTSAFKPVVHQQKAETTSIKSRRRSSIPQPKPSDANIIMPPNSSHPTSSQNNSCNSLFSSDEDDHDEEHDVDEVHRISPNNDHKQYVTEHSEVLDDDILVDIETTEDEKPVSFSTNTITSTCSRTSFTVDNSESPDEIEGNVLDNEKQTASDEDVIDVVHNDNDDTVLEFASLTPLAIVKHTKDNERISPKAPITFTSPITTTRCGEEVDKLYNVDYSNAENVPPLALSISPKSNSSSPCSRSSEYFYLKSKSHYEAASGPNLVPKNSSRLPDISDDQMIHCNPATLEKPTKNLRKRPCEKFVNDEIDKTNWRYSQDNSIADEDARSDVVNAVDSSQKYKKKSLEPNTKEAQLMEALTQKYELTYYNNNNTACKNNYANNNNKVSNNNISNTNSNEFWQMARLCMQRPITYEQSPKVHQQQHNHQQLNRLPTFYYRQQQFLLSPVEQHHQQQQHQQNNITPSFPATQQVYLHLQHQQAVQKSQNYYTNEISQSSSSHSSSHNAPVSTPVYTSESADTSSASINLRQNNQDNG